MGSIEPGHLARPHEDTNKHGCIQATGIGIAKRWMIAADESQPIGQRVLCPMRKSIERSALDHTGLEQVCQVAIERNLAQADNDPHTRKGFDLCGQVRRAIADLLWSRLVARRSATHHRADPDMAQLQAVVARDCIAMIRQADLMQNGIHEVSRAVTGKRPACPVRSMRAGSQAENQNPCPWIAKARNGTRPVGVVEIGATLHHAKVAAVGAQPFAAFTGDDSGTDLVEGLIQDSQGLARRRRWFRRTGADRVHFSLIISGLAIQLDTRLV